MSILLQKQQLFLSLVPALINHINAKGYRCTLGDGYRDPRVFGPIGKKVGYGHPKSAHKQRLAIDILIFAPNGLYLTETEDYRFAGEFWLGLHVDCRWGGLFEDGNHFSMIHEGVM